MTINKHTHARWRIICRIWLAVTLIGFASVYFVKSSKPQSLIHVTFNLSNIQQQFIFSHDKVFFLYGIAYDYYSLDEMDDRVKPGSQWKTFPLPNEQISLNVTPWRPSNYQKDERTSVPITIPSQSPTGLAFIDQIYITTVPELIDRRNNLEKMFTRYKITNYEWRLKWTHDTCNAPENKQEVHGKLNLSGKKPISSSIRRRQCSLTMKHVDIWHDVASRNSSLSLILEDDAVFVPHFREKLDRTIFTAIRTGALKLGGLEVCIKNKARLPPNSNEWFEQEPVIFIGSCMHSYDRAFQKNRQDAPPMLSTHKSLASRCVHAYLLTACSAQALIRQISAKKSVFVQADLY